MNSKEHLFECLSEECAEVIQAICKTNRFAIDGHYPDGRSNVDVVVYELNDVFAVVELLIESGVDLTQVLNREQIEAKKIKVKEMMKLAVERGSLRDL
jgi:hypothetical protein